MAYPIQSGIRVDPQLDKMLLAKSNEAKNYISEQILPVIGVSEVGGRIPSIGNSHLRTFDSQRAPYDETEHRMEFRTSNTDTYLIQYRDLNAFIPDILVNAEQPPFDLKVAASWVVMQAMLLEKDRALGALLTNTATYAAGNTVTLSGGSQFNNYLTSDIAGAIETGKTAIFNKSGREANCILLSRAVFNTLKYHPFFLNQLRAIAFAGDEMLIDLIKSNFGFDNVFIGKTISVTSQEGQTTDTFDTVWGKDIVIFYRPEQPTLFEPAFGYTFKLTGKDLITETFRDANQLGWKIRVKCAYHQKVTDTTMAYNIHNAIA